MQSLVIYAMLLPIWVISCQIILYTLKYKDEQRQKGCRTLGVLFVTIGIVSLASRDFTFVISGLLQIMIGLRLIASGLDRIDKKIFIDRFKDD